MSSSSEKTKARVPRRERGKRRVTALLEAAASLFAEKGYDAVTMTEVAARAGAPIGSLYQFFPGKEALGDALLDRFRERLDDMLGEIEERATALTIPALADAWIGLLDGFKGERAAVRALLEARREISARASELRMAIRQHVTRVLRTRTPTISPRRAECMASVIVQLMKAAARQGDAEDTAIRDDVLEEMRRLVRLYLADTMVNFA